jgi:hypothetical protein
VSHSLLLDLGSEAGDRPVMGWAHHLSHQFVIDPGKRDFYATDCCRRSGQDDLAQA